MKTILAAATAWGLAIFAGIALARLPQLRLPPGSRSVAALLLGGARSVLSDDMYQRADLYYHGGVAHRHEPGGEHRQTETPTEAAGARGRRFSPLSEADTASAPHKTMGKAAAAQPRGYSIIREGRRTEAGDHEHGHEGEETAVPRWDLWSRLNRRIHPSGHRHLRGPRYEKEVLPWLWAAIRCNPHNVTAYDVAAYWVAERLKHPEEGLKILAEGIRNNPDAYRLEFTRGEILLHMLKDREAAFNAFHAAMRKWETTYARAPEKKKPDVFQYGNILLYLAVLSERKNALEDARRYYKAALDTREGNARKDIARRLAAVEEKLGAEAESASAPKPEKTGG
ncbi:MAG: hypothetical protein GXP31_18035 [Kiritimatiellaeota bacterium]|nr:hypothetical protein [Kiritimatiellota bacterium]